MTIALAKPWNSFQGNRASHHLFTREEDGNTTLYFYTEAQAVVNWGISLDDIGLNDPPVILDEWWEIENNTFSEFITQMVVLETTCFGGFGANASANFEALETVKQNFVLLGFPEWHWPAYPSRLYGGSDILIEAETSQDGSSWIWIGARTQVALRQAAQMFTLDWERLDLE